MGALGGMAFFMNSGRRFGVDSVQYGSTTSTATISAVVVNRSVVMWLGCDANSANTIAYVTLTNSTTVTSTPSDGTPLVYFVVIQFAAGSVKSIQDFTVGITGTATSGTATITSVNTAKAVIFYRGPQHNTNDNLSSIFVGVTLTNSTTVTGTRTSGDGSASYFQGTVVEFN